jgi:hypothetical protein
MGNLSVTHLVDLNLEILPQKLIHLSLHLDLLRLYLVETCLLRVEGLSLLFDLSVHLLGVLLVLLDALDDLIFENLHAALQFPNSLWERVISFLGAHSLGHISGKEKVCFEVFFLLVQVGQVVLHSLARLDTWGCQWIGVELFVE